MKYPGLLLLLALLFPLAACSYTTYLSGADERGGTVNMVTELNKDSAIEKAKAHCQQYNLTAQITGNDRASSTLTFACQPPL